MRRLYGVLLGVMLIQCSLFGQSVIVNEISQGSDSAKEWVELLVVDAGVNLQGWELGDYDDGIWHSIAELTSHSDWSEVAAGTIIVIYNSGDIDGMITAAGGEDTDFSDKSVIIPINNATYVNDTGPWGLTSGAFSNSDSDDCPAIRNAEDVIIHDMAGGHPTATVTGPGSGQVKYFTGNTAGGTSVNTNWTVANSTSGTPGASNGGDNSSWADNSLPVELSAWTATSTHGHVTLNWTTESEIENLGFVVYRKQNSESSNQELVSFKTHEVLLGQGSTTARNSYQFVDIDVEVGQTYTYQLSDVDYQGDVTRHAEISVTVKSIKQDLKPVEMLLGSAYPNPFNSEITISFTIPQESAGDVSLQVFDLKGRLAKTLILKTGEFGSLTAIWDARQFTSGIYIVRLAVGTLVQIQRVTLLR